MSVRDSKTVPPRGAGSSFEGCALFHILADGGAHPASAFHTRVSPYAPLGHRRARKSRSISRAALWPGAPVTPPPGWVEAPHMYKPGIGARWSACRSRGGGEEGCSRLGRP